MTSLPSRCSAVAFTNHVCRASIKKANKLRETTAQSEKKNINVCFSSWNTAPDSRVFDYTKFQSTLIAFQGF